jgi:hypothetical protein
MGLARKMARKSIVPNMKEQRRQAEITAKSQSIARQINMNTDKAVWRAEVNAFYKLSILANWVLHEKFGFGAQAGGRLEQFQDEMARLCACISDPNCGITVDTINAQLKEETGYDTVWHLNNRRYNEKAEVAS